MAKLGVKYSFTMGDTVVRHYDVVLYIIYKRVVFATCPFVFRIQTVESAVVVYAN